MFLVFYKHTHTHKRKQRQKYKSHREHNHNLFPLYSNNIDISPAVFKFSIRSEETVGQKRKL